MEMGKGVVEVQNKKVAATGNEPVTKKINRDVVLVLGVD